MTQMAMAATGSPMTMMTRRASKTTVLSLWKSLARPETILPNYGFTVAIVGFAPDEVGGQAVNKLGRKEAGMRERWDD